MTTPLPAAGGPLLGSLGARLSALLAVQTIVALGAVCGAVYLVIAMSMSQRQMEVLTQKEAAMVELLKEHPAPADPVLVAHSLNDMLAGHDDFSLRIDDGAGRRIYERGPLLSGTPGRALRRDFVVDGAVGPSPFVLRGQLYLDTRTDAAMLTRLAWTLGVAAVAGAAAVSLGGYWLVRRSLGPLRQLVRQTASIAATGTGDRLDGAGQPEELQPLIAQFNALLDRASVAYRQLEHFNADVAHELNTPLSTLISSCEVALRRSRDKAALEDTLASNLEELRRLAGVVADMLFLSQADRGALARGQHVERLSSVAADVLDFHEAALQEAGLQARIVGEASATVDAKLLRRALSNLLGNATRYAAPGSIIEIRLQAAGTPQDAVALSVRNQGLPIAPRHLPHIFDRFYRADTSRAHADRNHGLGLAIVDAIAHMHGGATFARSDEQGTEIGWRFPARRP